MKKIWVWDPGSGKNLFRIPDSGVKKVPDPQHWILGIPDPHPDPFVSGTDPRIRIRNKISWIPNAGYPDETKPEQYLNSTVYSI